MTGAPYVCSLWSCYESTSALLFSAAGHMAHISFLGTAGWGQTLSLFCNMLTESFWAWLDVNQTRHLTDIWGSWCWGEYVARCGNSVSLVSSSFCRNIIGHWSLDTQRTHRFNSYRIWEPISHKIMQIWCFPLYAIMKYFKLIQQCFDLLIRVQ